MPAPADRLAPPFAIAGVDEVGRGPLAGPVVAAAVVLDPRRPIDGLDDSKRLGEPERERLDALIRRRALAWCVASASVEEIDALNILRASLLAMQRAVAGLAPSDGTVSAATATATATATVAAAEAEAEAEAAALSDPFERRPGAPGFAPSLVLVDGNRCPALPYPSAAVVGGDGRVRAIAAASIVAKVARDALMRRWDERHPGFGFAAHKGYATKTHRDALARLGATPLHRRSFAPVRDALGRAASTRSPSPRPSDQPTSPNDP